MLELNAKVFLAAVTELRQIQILINNIPDQTKLVDNGDMPLMSGHVIRLIDAVQAIGARSAFRSADRLHKALQDPAQSLTYLSVNTVLADIERRFADHLDDITLFVIADSDGKAFYDGDVVDGEVSFNFPSAVFELEEAAKCLALARHTAAVFHIMRVLEIGIRSLARFLDIDDPVRPAQRNWAIILKTIRSKIDEKWPVSTSLLNADRQKVDGLYATLDAVRNPWRNATMHVETIYAPHEATHIYNCAHFFMQKLAAVCDEEGDESL
jgi:hypothetical protein